MILSHSENLKKQSSQNKDNRTHQQVVHCMGKTSSTMIREILKNTLGHEPTRAKLFEVCFTRPNGMPINEKAQEAIASMKEIDAQIPEGSSPIIGPDDTYAKVIGKDKPERVTMYGLGVTPSDMYGTIPSCVASYRMAMQYKTSLDILKKQYESLNNKLEELSLVVMHGQKENSNSHDTNSASTTSLPNDGCFFPGSTPNDNQPLRVGVYVILKSISNIEENVAIGIINNLDPTTKVGREQLGPNWCEVLVQVQLKRDEHLIRPYGLLKTIEDAIGAPIAWPLSLVVHDENREN